jgi:SAM-dependent methyltransferase
LEISFNLIAALVSVAIIGALGVAGGVVVFRIRRAGLALHREIAEAFAQMVAIRDEISTSRSENSQHIARLGEGLAAIRADALPVADTLSRIADITSRILDSAYETETRLHGIANQLGVLAAAQHESSDRAALARIGGPPLRKRLRKLNGAAGSPQFSSQAQATEQGGVTRLILPEGRWAYAAVIPLTIPTDLIGPVWVRVRAAVLDGHACFGLLNCAGDDCQERIFVDADPSTHAIFLRLKDAGDVSGVVIQNSRPDGKGGEILLEGVSVYVDEGVEDGRPQTAWPYQPGVGGDILLRDSFDLLRRKWGEVPATTMDRIDSQDLLKLADSELLARWDYFRSTSVTGSAFRRRGWYDLMYRDMFRGKKVLDLGSGLAITSLPFAENGAEVTFVDLVQSNLDVLRRLCRLKGIANTRFRYMEDLGSLSDLEADYDFIYCCGSMINAPLDVTRLEAQALLKHLKVGGRWIELAYPKSRWEREGSMPFDLWGEKTDGGAPWMEWHDLDKVLGYLAPAQFEVILELEFHNGDFNWFDLLRRS